MFCRSDRKGTRRTYSLYLILDGVLRYYLLSDLTLLFFFFNDTAPTEIYTLSLHDALPISGALRQPRRHHGPQCLPRAAAAQLRRRAARAAARARSAGAPDAHAEQRRTGGGGELQIGRAHV